MKAEQDSRIGGATELIPPRGLWDKAQQIISVVLLVLALPNVVMFLYMSGWLPDGVSELFEAGGWWFCAAVAFGTFGCVFWGTYMLILRVHFGLALACLLFGLFCLTFMQLIPVGR